jgi:hypothetical protein
MNGFLTGGHEIERDQCKVSRTSQIPAGIKSRAFANKGRIVNAAARMLRTTIFDPGDGAPSGLSVLKAIVLPQVIE